MTRVDGWPDRLASLIRERRGRPFEWGQNDCALWASDCVLAVNGWDPGEAYRGTYRTARGAAIRLRRVDGVSDPVALADKKLGERRHPAMARIGDVVAWRGALGVCYGRNSFFVGTRAGEHGLVTVATSEVDHCYHAPGRSHPPSDRDRSGRRGHRDDGGAEA